MKNSYKIMTGWGFNNEVTVEAGVSRNEAIELYEELHADWLESCLSDECEKYNEEQAQMKRPCLIYTDENGDSKSV